MMEMSDDSTSSRQLFQPGCRTNDFSPMREMEETLVISPANPT